MRSVGMSSAPQFMPELVDEENAGKVDTQGDSFNAPNIEIPDSVWNKFWVRNGSGGKYNYLARGMYYDQLQFWHRHFPVGESMLVLNYEKDY